MDRTVSLPPPAVTATFGPDPSRDAFARRAWEILAVPDDELLLITVDVPGVCALVLERLGDIRSHREAIVRELGGIDLAAFDGLEDYALALRHTHAAYDRAATPLENLASLVKESVELREALVADATTLSRQGIIDRRKIAALRGNESTRHVALDLLTLATALREAWPLVGETPIAAPGRIQRADVLGDQLLRAVHKRERTAVELAEASVLRQKAFTLLSRAYGQARRALHYLRFEQGDAETIAPSLYTGSQAERPFVRRPAGALAKAMTGHLPRPPA